jgi:hypothetical protein
MSPVIVSARDLNSGRRGPVFHRRDLVFGTPAVESPTNRALAADSLNTATVPWELTRTQRRRLFTIGILQDGPCCWLRAGPKFPH